MPTVTLMHGYPSTGLNMKLKAAATAIGDPTADRASAHGFRRGFACDLATEGDSVKDILEAGDWRSAAFRRYLETVENGIHLEGGLAGAGGRLGLGAGDAVNSHVTFTENF